MHADFKDKGLVVRLISFRETSADTVKRVVRERRYTIPALHDESAKVAGLYGVVGPPTVVFIDRSGRIVGRAVGSRNWNSAAGRSFIQALLNEPEK